MKGDSVAKCILAIIGSTVFCFGFVVAVFYGLINGYLFGKSLTGKSLRQRWCKHEWVKISHKAVRKEGKYIVKRTKWRCKKCGKEKYSDKP